MPGPYIQLATICERVLEEKDGTLSIIRMFDRFTVTSQGDSAPAELPEGQLPLTLAIALKSDEARGRHPIIIRVQQPSGVYLPDRPVDVMFEGEERGVNLILQFQLDALEGIYWFEVLCNENLLTRVPLRVVYLRSPTTA